MKLQKWERSDNYIGETFFDYYVGCGQSRDSDNRETTNFAACLDRLGGESKTVIVFRASHWLVGWTETILVHESDTERLKELSNIGDELESYPLLDEDAFIEAEQEDTESLYEDAEPDIFEKLDLVLINNDTVKENQREREDITKPKTMEYGDFYILMFDLIQEGCYPDHDTHVFQDAWNDNTCYLEDGASNQQMKLNFAA
jgi:hypothetical protein